ncbi:unnamed protein product [Blepharisma stoltei]|uniref:C2H2-type domain-containing protein n=1 Tax=Blepharisma stoltei TaxID=1481888 RepID=A0AAU9JVS7_9CILI|nr:unnamed protein product [Blepharisma stoltei]
MTDAKVEINGISFLKIEKNNLTQHLFPEETEFFKCCTCLKLLPRPQAETHQCKPAQMEIDKTLFDQVGPEKYKCQVCSKVLHNLLLKAHAFAHSNAKVKQPIPIISKPEEKTQAMEIEETLVISSAPQQNNDVENQNGSNTVETPTPNLDSFVKIAMENIEKTKKPDKAAFCKSFIKSTENAIKKSSKATSSQDEVNQKILTNGEDIQQLSKNEEETKKISISANEDLNQKVSKLVEINQKVSKNEEKAPSKNDEKIHKPQKNEEHAPSISKIITSTWNMSQKLPVKRQRSFGIVSQTIKKAKKYESIINHLSRISNRVSLVNELHSFRIWKIRKNNFNKTNS